MKIIDYPQIPELSEDNVFLVDGTSGTKIIRADNLITFLLNMLDPEDFIGYIDLTSLQKVVTLESENLILVADADGNKAMVADKAAENLLALMDAAKFSKKLNPAALETNQDIVADDVLVMGDAENGVRKITGENAAQSILSLMNQTNFTKKVKPSTLTANLDLTTGDQLLMEDASDGTRKIEASVAAKSLLTLMPDADFANKLKVTEYGAVNVITNTDEFLIKTANGLKRISYDNIKIEVNKPANIQARKLIYGGRNLGSTITQSMINEINNNNFEQFFLGDYFTDAFPQSNDVGKRAVIYDFNYYYAVGNMAIGYHLNLLSAGSCRDSRAVFPLVQPYKTSQFVTTYIPEIIKNNSSYLAPWLQTRLKSFDILVASAVENGIATAHEWINTKAAVPSAVELFGFTLNDNAHNPISIPRPFALCSLLGCVVNYGNGNYWIRDITGESNNIKYYMIRDNYSVVSAHNNNSSNVLLRCSFAI